MTTPRPSSLDPQPSVRSLPPPSTGEGSPRSGSGKGSTASSGEVALSYPACSAGTLPRRRGRVWRAAPPLLALAALAACTPRTPSPTPPTGTLRERVAALALRQSDFGSVSLIPVRFEHSRIAGPFADGGRTLYCVSTHMKGRTFGKAERAKAVIQDKDGVLTLIEDNEELCSGHRTEPFSELEALGNKP